MTETRLNSHGDEWAPTVDTPLIEGEEGSRAPSSRWVSRLLWWVLLAWAVFQVWIASPLPYEWGIGVWNSTQTRAIHLSFAIFIAFAFYPATRRSPHHHIPMLDWVLALVAAACAAYLAVAYEALAGRMGLPTALDLAVSGIGLVLLLEAARRTLGLPLMLVAVLFLAYVFFGSIEFLPDILRWKGASFAKAMNHMWLTTEGVFGVPLGISSEFVFLFVLFGALLNHAGAGDYFIQLAFSLLGHMRAGPAKAAVISSAMTGLVSGSSLANVVTTGTFTIPLMKKSGFTPERAAAVEASSSVNGVLTPPIMGAVAFLMTSYVGVSYVEVIKTATIPALISYIALVYIVHLEAEKNGMVGLPRSGPASTWKSWALRTGLILSGTLFVAGCLYYAVMAIRGFLGSASGPALLVLVLAIYLALLKFASGSPDPKIDMDADITELPEFRDIYKAGVHFIVPLVILVWLLIVERKSPSYSALFASVAMALVLLTQKPLKAWFRGEPGLWGQIRQGAVDLAEGIVAGSRGMVGIAIACATAGIIVGTVTLTGVGLVMAAFVELLSGGNLFLMLVFVALISIILGMGLPSTANYIVVSSLMAGVVVNLAAQGGLVLPLIAVHMFVFYYGIIGDVTPPVGLGSYAAAAIARADPIKTGLVACFYSLRTAALPFLFVFNTELLLIDVSPGRAILVFIVSLAAMLLFAAGTMGFFIARSRLWESAALLLVSFTLFRPGFFLDLVSPPYVDVEPQQIVQMATGAPAGAELRVRMSGMDIDGNDRQATFLLPLADPASGDGAARLLKGAGLAFETRANGVFVDELRFGQAAQKMGIDYDWQLLTIENPQERPPKEVFYIPALLLLALVASLQRRRKRAAAPAAVPDAAPTA